MSDIMTILLAWTLTCALQVLAVPFLIPRFKDSLLDGGWAFGRIVIWLLMGTPIWVLANFRLPVNTPLGVTFMIGIITALSLVTFLKKKNEISTFLMDRWRVILADEIIFAMGFFFMCYVRMTGPEIIDLEKFMDVGLMSSYWRAPRFPVLDMWLAGSTMNYYTFGHFLGSVMSRIWGWQTIPYNYNLLLALLMGLSLVHSFSLASTFVAKVWEGKKELWPTLVGGAVGSFLVVFGGNTQTIWYGIKNHGWKGYWYPDATRFIPNTIHEFPSYSFIVSDLHAHLWDMPIVLFLVALIFGWYRLAVSGARGRIVYMPALGVGLVMGISVMTNAWDGAVYSLLLFIGGVSLLIFRPDRIKEIFISYVIIAATGIVLSSTWWLRFDPISKGINLVEAGTPFWQLLVVWGGFWCLSGVAFLVANNQLKKISDQEGSRDWPQTAVLGLVMCLAVAAWVLILLPELFYVKDIYPGHPRANTMFKFTFQSFIMMGLVSGWVIGYIFHPDFIKNRRGGKIVRVSLLILTLAIAGAQLIFPYFGYRDRFDHFRKIKGLNGLAWLEDESPYDYEGILWINRRVKGQPVILEAVGTSYSKFSRVSAFTGLPTVVGWPVHEWLWRGTYDVPGPRVDEVKRMYETPYADGVIRLFDKYAVEYIFVGDKEYEAYPLLDAPKLRSLGAVVFEKGRTFIVQRTGSYVLPPQ